MDFFDSEELAASLCCVDSEDIIKIEEALQEKFDVDLETFTAIAQALFKRIDIGVSPLTNTPMIGFSDKKDGHGCWLIKKEIENEFIAAVIRWSSEGTDIPVDGGFEKEITNEGKVEYIISIVGPEWKAKKQKQTDAS